MTLNEYQLLAMRTNDRKSLERLKGRVDEFELDIDIGGLINACLGLSGETGELLDMVKKWIFHGVDMDWVHLKKELGDVLWYVTLMCDSLDWYLGDVAKTNVDKLMARYPEGFDIERSAHRGAGDI